MSEVEVATPQPNEGIGKRRGKDPNPRRNRPKMPNRRLEGWEDRLGEIVEGYRGKNFNWLAGVNCFFFAMDVVKGMTGVDPYEEERGLIRSEEEAEVRMKARGFDGIEGAIEAEFKEVPVSLAHRGDIGFILWRGALILVVFINAGVVGLTERGLKFLPRSQVYKAYKVGRA